MLREQASPHAADAGAAAGIDEPRQPWPRTLAVLGVMAGCFAFQEMAILPALPTIQRQLAGANTTTTALLESGFLIVAAVAAPLLGKLGDCHGKKKMLLATLAVYFVGSLGAGLAPDFMALILFRALQGVGGALMLLSIAISRDSLPAAKLDIGIGWIVGSFGTGACLGLGLSGVITEFLSWRYIFFVECALIAIGAILVLELLPDSEHRCAEPVDYAGVALLGCALASLIMGLTETLSLGWPVVGLFLLAVAFFAAWIVREKRTDAPLLDVAVLTSARVLFPNLGSAFAGYAVFSAFFLVPRFVQVPRHLPARIVQELHYGFGAGVIGVGLYLLPLGVGLLCAGPGGGMIGRCYGGKWTFVSGLAMVACACALLAFLHGDKFLFSLWLFLLGAGFGLSIGAASVFVTETVDPQATGIANAFLSLMRLIAGGIGAQVAAMLLRSQSIAAGVPRESAFTLAFALSALLALVGTGVGLLVPGDRRGDRNNP